MDESVVFKHQRLQFLFLAFRWDQPFIDLFFQQTVLTTQLIFYCVVMMEFGGVLSTFDFVFLFLVFKTSESDSQILDMAGEESLLLCHNLQQGQVLLVLLGKRDKVLDFELLAVLFSDSLVALFHR